jgi:hypothetical protein
VEYDVGGVNIVKVTVPTGRLVLGVNIAGFAVLPDIFLQFRLTLSALIYK